jgi:hypothetical protein
MGMSELVIVAIFGFLGTCVGALGGILASNRLVMFRLDKLEKKVDAHNHFDRRLVCVEKDVEQLKVRAKA